MTAGTGRLLMTSGTAAIRRRDNPHGGWRTAEPAPNPRAASGLQAERRGPARAGAAQASTSCARPTEPRPREPQARRPPALPT